jgi:hypothetical protein
VVLDNEVVCNIPTNVDSITAEFPYISGMLVTNVFPPNFIEVSYATVNDFANAAEFCPNVRDCIAGNIIPLNVDHDII